MSYFVSFFWLPPCNKYPFPPTVHNTCKFNTRQSLQLYVSRSEGKMQGWK